MTNEFDRSINALETELSAVALDLPDDRFVADATREALLAARAGNFGVGAIVVDESDAVVARGRNRVFMPSFRSDLHAEMDVMNRLEATVPLPTARSHRLYTSLECCPMCLTRLITSGIGTIRYAAADQLAGMVQRLEQMPPVWRDLADRQDIGTAECSEALASIAWRVFEVTRDSLDSALAAD